MGLLVDSGLTWPIYAKKISDWILGDDREWQGSFPLNLFPSTETGVSDIYLTIKSDPTQADASALVQVHITPVASQGGVITVTSGNVNVGLRVLGGNISGSLIPNGPLGPYSYDMRAISSPNGLVWTFESGTIQFLQDTTQVGVAGTPAVLPNAGLPIFRGFAFSAPTTGTFNRGDWFRNANASPGAPSGWVCIVGGTPGTWVTDGLMGNDLG